MLASLVDLAGKLPQMGETSPTHAPANSGRTPCHDAPSGARSDAAT